MVNYSFTRRNLTLQFFTERDQLCLRGICLKASIFTMLVITSRQSTLSYVAGCPTWLMTSVEVEWREVSDVFRSSDTRSDRCARLVQGVGLSCEPAAAGWVVLFKCLRFYIIKFAFVRFH